MKVMKISELPSKKATSTLFEGAVTQQPAVDEKMCKALQVGVVNFSPGAKNVFHIHSNNQILYVTEGKGIVASETEEFIVEPGTIIFIPAGERHWHGATQDISFSQSFYQNSGRNKILNKSTFAPILGSGQRPPWLSMRTGELGILGRRGLLVIEILKEESLDPRAQNVFDVPDQGLHPH